MIRHHWHPPGERARPAGASPDALSLVSAPFPLSRRARFRRLLLFKRHSAAALHTPTYVFCNPLDYQSNRGLRGKGLWRWGSGRLLLWQQAQLSQLPSAGVTTQLRRWTKRGTVDGRAHLRGCGKSFRTEFGGRFHGSLYFLLCCTAAPPSNDSFTKLPHPVPPPLLWPRRPRRPVP